DRSSEPSTNDLQTCDSSVECSRPNHSDRDSTDYISSVSTPVSESRDTIVIDCDKQKDFPSICSIETDVKSSKPLCNKFGSFNKESYFRKHKFVASKSCYVCGSYFHLIKDCDLHEQRFAKRNAEGKGKLGSRPTGKQVNPNRPKPVSAGQPNPVSAGQPNPVSAGQANPVSAGDGILGPRPLNIQTKSKYFHSFTHNNQQIIFPITHNLLYSFYMTGRLNGKTAVKPSAGWHWIQYGKISGKGTIKTKNLNFENVLYVEERQHFNLISISQICDQSHRVFFTEKECLVLSKDFPLPDPSMVILSIPRKHNLYTFSLNELSPKGPLTCLIAKALQNESTLWHRRLGHVNFRNMNKLVKGNLIRGTGQAWLFDIDYLTDSLNYSRVSSTNLTAGSQGAIPFNVGSHEDNSDSDDEPDVLIIHSTLTPVVPIVDEATTQNDGKEEADQLGLAFPSLNLILGVGSTPISSSVYASSTPPVSAGSTPPMSQCASPISAGRPSGSAARTPIPTGRILGKLPSNTPSERFPLL
nr:ribonuclease H-like domain-containing protein [Tanacetum cinerariifolium]